MGTIGIRMRRAAADPRGAARRASARAQTTALAARSRLSRRRATGDADVVVSLTSYGHRLDTVHLAIESIIRGTARPARLILWISDPGYLPDLPPRLERLRARGVEILPTPDFGPYKKQYAYATTRAHHTTALVVCDDDAVYPRGWLRGLLAAQRRHPDEVLAYRGHSVRVDDGQIAPYALWEPAPEAVASFATVGTGVGGVLYPPALLDAVRDAGEAFRERAPRADDLWVHWLSVRAGIRTRQIPSRYRDYPQIPGSQKGTLYGENVRSGGNDVQARATYGPDEIVRIARDAARGR